jgi:hypothetical protein
MRQEQKAMLGIVYSDSFVSGALSGRLYQMTQPNPCPYLRGQFAQMFNAAYPNVVYVVRSQGIVLAWMTLDGTWTVVDDDLGNVFARHRRLVNKAIAFRQKREAAA